MQTMTRDQNAVFAYAADGRRYRVTAWSDGFKTSDAEWDELDRNRADVSYAVNGSPVRYFACRNSADPQWRESEHAEMTISEDRRPQWVKLTAGERSHILDIGRRAIQDYPKDDPSTMDIAAEVMGTAIDEIGRFSHLEYTVISDYAWSAARFLCPRAARY